MPVRKIPKNYRNVTGVAASAGKSEGAAQFESTLERDFLTLLRFSPDVKKFEVQPITIPWWDAEGIKRGYTLDTLVFFHEACSRRPWLCEVKYRSDLKEHWAEWRPKFKAAVKYARDHGWRFRLMTEVEIRTPYLKNANFLLPFRRDTPDPSQSNAILDLVAKLEDATPEKLIKALGHDLLEQASLLHTIWCLVATGQLAADLGDRLTNHSRVWRSA